MRIAFAAAGAAALLLAGPALAQSGAPAQPAERPAAGEPRLDLRLDDATKAKPRINFGPPAQAPAPRPAQTAPDPASTLPALGANPGGPSFTRPLGTGGGGGGSGGGPFPKDTNPGL